MEGDTPKSKGRYCIPSGLTVLFNTFGKRLLQVEGGRRCVYILNDGHVDSKTCFTWNSKPDICVPNGWKSAFVISERAFTAEIKIMNGRFYYQFAKIDDDGTEINQSGWTEDYPQAFNRVFPESGKQTIKLMFGIFYPHPQEKLRAHLFQQLAVGIFDHDQELKGLVQNFCNTLNEQRKRSRVETTMIYQPRISSDSVPSDDSIRGMDSIFEVDSKLEADFSEKSPSEKLQQQLKNYGFDVPLNVLTNIIDTGFPASSLECPSLTQFLEFVRLIEEVALEKWNNLSEPNFDMDDIFSLEESMGILTMKERARDFFHKSPFCVYLPGRTLEEFVSTITQLPSFCELQQKILF